MVSDCFRPIEYASPRRALNRKPLWFFVAVTTLAVMATACDPAPSSDRQPRSQVDSGSPAAVAAASRPIDPDEFVEEVDNPLFALEPGTTFRLRGATEDGIEQETVIVTKETKKILGVPTTVVKDIVRVEGRLAELTFDWYAQDRDGNVWYFGEDTAEYERGKVVSREGSWKSGVDGAQPGIIMNANPQVTDSYRQEYYAGHAEDMYWVVAIGESQSVPFGHFEDTVRTLEWTPLEPRVVVEKLYAPGVGLVAERALSGPKERVELIDVVRP